MSFTHAPIKLEMIGKLFLRLQDYLVHIRESSRLWWCTSQRGSGRGGAQASEVWFASDRQWRLLRQQQRAAHVVGSGTPPAPMGTAYHRRRRRLMQVHPC